MSTDLAAKRHKLMRCLKQIGLSGAEAIKVVINTTEKTIDEALREAQDEMRSRHEPYKQAGTEVRE